MIYFSNNQRDKLFFSKKLFFFIKLTYIYIMIVLLHVLTKYFFHIPKRVKKAEVPLIYFGIVIDYLYMIFPKEGNMCHFGRDN